MKNQEKHQTKFVRRFVIPEGSTLEEGKEVVKDSLQKSAAPPWCSREGLKEVIDDLTDEELEVVTEVLGHLYLLNEKFPTLQASEKLIENINAFCAGKTIKRVTKIGAQEWFHTRLSLHGYLCFDRTALPPKNISSDTMLALAMIWYVLSSP
jgi:hypothetical protein